MRMPQSYNDRIAFYIGEAEKRYPVPNCFLCIGYRLRREGSEWVCQCDERESVKKRIEFMSRNYWQTTENYACGCDWWEEVYD